MSEGNKDTKLIFDTLIGKDTLTQTLTTQLGHVTKLVTELGNLKAKAGEMKSVLGDQGLTLVEVSSLKTGLQLLNSMHLGSDALAKMKVGLGTSDLTTIKAITASMSELIGLTTQYSQLSNKQLQLSAFSGKLTTAKEVEAHSKNIEALKAINKGFSQSGIQNEASKEAIRLIELHNKGLRDQARLKREIESHDASVQRNRVIGLAHEIREGKSRLTQIRKTSELEAKQLENRLKAHSLRSDLTPEQKSNVQSALRATQSRLTQLQAQKFTKPKELEYFNKLTAGDSKDKAKGTVALQNMTQYIGHLRKTGQKEDLLKWTEVYQQAKSTYATKFKPISPYQEAAETGRKNADKLGRLNPADIARLSRDEVQRHLEASKVRGDKVSAPFGSELHTQEREYQKALQRRTEQLNKAAAEAKGDTQSKNQMAKKALEARLKEEEVRQKNAVSLQRKVDNLSLAPKEGPPSYSIDPRKSIKDDIFKKARTGNLSSEELQKFILGSGDKARLLGELKSLQRQTRKAELDPNVLSLEANAPKRLNTAINAVIQKLNEEKDALAASALAAKKLAAHNHKMANDPVYAEKFRLKQYREGLATQATNQRATLIGDSEARLRARAEDIKRFEQARQNSTYHTPTAVAALQPTQFREARAALNYASRVGPESERSHAKDMLALLKLREQEEARIARAAAAAGQHQIQQMTLIKKLAESHYFTKESLNGLNRQELELAKQVLKYRQSIAQTPQARLHDTQTLNHANQLSRLDPQNQADHRASSRERVLGDGGASLMAIQAGLMLNYKLLGGFQNLFSGAISSAMELDAAFKQLQAISAATNYEMVGLKLNLIDVAQASKFSAAEVGHTAVLLAQAGFTVSEISASMRGVIMLAQATGTELGKAVDVVTSVISVFNKSAATTEQIANQLTEALNRSKLDIQKMALGIQYAGNISADAGVTFEELTSALGAMANAGIRSGSTLGTGFRQMLLDLERPSTKLKDRLDGLGISLNQIDFRANGLAGVLKNLRAAGFTTADAMATFEVRSAAAFSALSGNLEDFDALQESLLDTSAAFQANYVQMEGLAVQLDHLKSNLGIVAAEGLKPITALVRDVAKAFAHMMENSEEGSTALRVFGTVLGSITAAIAVAWLARMTAGLVSMTFAARAASGALIGLSKSGWVGVIVGAGFATAAYFAHTNELERMTTALDTATGKNNQAKEVYESTKDSIRNIDEAIKKVVDRYGTLVASQVETTKTGVALEAQFKELGLTFDDLTNLKAPALIARLKELREVQFDKQIEDANLLRDTTVAELDQKVISAKEFLKSEEFQTLKAILPRTMQGKVSLDALEKPNLEGLNPFRKVEVLRKNLAAEASLALESGKVKPNKEYSPADTISQIRRLLILNGSSFQRPMVKQIEASIAVAEKAFQHAKVLANAPENRNKAVERADRTAAFANSMRAAYADPRSAVSGTEARNLAFNQFRDEADLNYPNLDERKVVVGQRARIELENIKANVAGIDKLLSELPKEGGTPQQSMNRTAWTAQKEEVLTNLKKYTDAVAEADAVLKEGNKKYLEMASSTARAGVAARKAIYDESLKVYQDSDILSQEKSRGADLESAFYELLEAEKVLARLTTKGGEAALAEKAQEQKSKMAEFARLRKEQLGKITSYGKEDKQKLETYTRELELKYYVEEQDAWMDELKAKRDKLDGSSKTRLAGLASTASRVLDDSEMFGLVNKDLAKQAKTVANRTGISQDYAQFGTGTGGFFARAAAKQQMAGVKAKFHQERLANNLVDLDPLKLRIAKEKEDVAKFEAQRKEAEDKLTELVDKQATGLYDRSETSEQIKLAEDQYNSVDKVLQAHKRSLEQMAKIKEQMQGETEESMNYLKEAVFDPIEELTKSLRAGQEAMSSGLSTILGDWASGMIQNTEDVKNAFEAMGKSILQSMLKVVTDRTATMFTDMLLGKSDGSTGLGILGKLGSSLLGGLGGVNTSGITDLPFNPLVARTASKGGFINGNYQGARHYAGGGYVSGTDVGHDIVPAYLRPSEYVLNPTATSALGKPFLDRLNSVTTGSLKQLEGKGTAPQVNVQGSPPVNVYVVSPDQQRQMGSNDVVVAIEDNIARGGSIKQLIKQVVSGQM